VGTADLHVHTALGDGMAEIPELLAYVEEETDLSIIAVTEHDDLRAAYTAREAWARGHYRFDVILGEEVTTLEGHLLALFIEEPVPSLKPLAPSLEAVHQQDGLGVIPHPMTWFTRSIGQRRIERILREGRDGVSFDGMETAGVGPAARLGRDKARRLNRERYHLAEVGGSDAHFLKAVGTSYTVFNGTTSDELRQAVLARTTSAAAGRYPSMRQIGLGQVMRQQWRGLLATPRKMGWLPTIASFLRPPWP
jgi:hypothetical protein